MVAPKKFKRTCVACGAIDAKMNKEHFWPEWLIERTGTHKSSVRFTPDKRINPKSLVVPLCVGCNADFGRELESPVSRIFGELEDEKGLSDKDAELLVRWLWKFEGLAWCFANPERMYTERYTLRQRVLQPIDEFRSNLALAVSLVAAIDPKFADAPMGLDSWTDASAVFVAGVFSRVAIMVLERDFEEFVPRQFGIYRLGNVDAPDRDAKLFYPPVGFRDCIEAVNVTLDAGLYLSHAHDLHARNRAAGLVEV
jgi:hypothetical protein